MSNRGRKPKPTNLHILNGNPSNLNLDERSTREPKPKPVAPTMPTWLKGEGKKMWERLVPELENLGLFTIVDGETFAAACQSWKVFVECQKFIEKNGLTYLYTNKNGSENIIERPEVKIGQKSLDQFRSFCTEFGLTPSSRTRIDIRSSESDYDPMSDLLSGVK